MRRILFIACTFALLVSTTPLYAFSYNATPPSYAFGSTSSMSPISSYTPTYSIGAQSPEYVPAMSGDLNPFDASQSIRKGGRPGKTDGDDPNQNPDIEGPVGDAIIPLLLIAVGYIIYRRRKYRNKALLLENS